MLSSTNLTDYEDMPALIPLSEEEAKQIVAATGKLPLPQIKQ